MWEFLDFSKSELLWPCVISMRPLTARAASFLGSSQSEQCFANTSHVVNALIFSHHFLHWLPYPYFVLSHTEVSFHSSTSPSCSMLWCKCWSLWTKSSVARLFMVDGYVIVFITWTKLGNVFLAYS